MKKLFTNLGLLSKQGGYSFLHLVEVEAFDYLVH